MPAWAAAPGWYSATKSRAEGPSYYFNELHTRHPTNLRHPERTPEGPGRLKAGGPNDEVAENPVFRELRHRGGTVGGRITSV